MAQGEYTSNVASGVFGGVVSGASSGGAPGMVIGGLIGLGKSLIENKAAKERAAKMVNNSYTESVIVENAEAHNELAQHYQHRNDDHEEENGKGTTVGVYQQVAQQVFDIHDQFRRKLFPYFLGRLYLFGFYTFYESYRLSHYPFL